MNNNINDFYQWAMHAYKVDDKMSTHPLNWMTLAYHSDMFSKKDRPLLTGLHPMREAMKTLAGNKYKYVVSPCSFKKLNKKAKMLNWDKINLAPIYEGVLKLVNEEFFLTGFEGTKVPIHKAWIIK